MPLVYLMVSDPGSSVAFDVKVSSDGGVTWRAAPLQGTLYITGLMGVLSDGTLLVSVVQPLPLYTYSDPYLYRWKAGETAWHQVVSAPIHGLDLSARPGAPRNDLDRAVHRDVTPSSS